jgi:hypothetical protein
MDSKKIIYSSVQHLFLKKGAGLTNPIPLGIKHFIVFLFLSGFVFTSFGEQKNEFSVTAWVDGTHLLYCTFNVNFSIEAHAGFSAILINLENDKTQVVVSKNWHISNVGGTNEKNEKMPESFEEAWQLVHDNVMDYLIKEGIPISPQELQTFPSTIDGNEINAIMDYASSNKYKSDTIKDYSIIIQKKGAGVKTIKKGTTDSSIEEINIKGFSINKQKNRLAVVIEYRREAPLSSKYEVSGCLITTGFK